MSATDLDVQNGLQELLEADCEILPTADEALVSVTTFADAGVMTYNRGLVLRLGDGSEFQITIVQSA